MPQQIFFMILRVIFNKFEKNPFIFQSSEYATNVLPDSIFSGLGMTYSTPVLRDSQRYDGPTIALHWLTAFLVVLQFVLGECWSWPTKPVHHLMVVAHLSAGIVLSAIMVFRIVWRLTKGRHLPGPPQPMDRALALGVEAALYVLILVEIVLGYLWRWGGGQDMSFFGVLIPSPFPHFQPALLAWIRGIHHWNAWLIIILATGHGMAALFHHFVLHDTLLERMRPCVFRGVRRKG